MTQAVDLMAILKEILPTVKIIDHIQVAKTKLSYLNTTEVPQDLVTIMSSLDQLYDVLPEGKAKEHAKQAKETLAKEKEKGAAKAKQSLEAVEESLDFSEVDLSVSTSPGGSTRPRNTWTRAIQRSRRGVDRGYGRGHVRRL